MDEDIKKLISERFNLLPESIKETILSSEYESMLMEISKQYNMSTDQLRTLEITTTLIMMGLIPLKDFEFELTKGINLDRIKCSQIIKIVSEKIFINIKDLLELMNTPVGEEPNLGEEGVTKTTGDSNKSILTKAGIEIIDETSKNIQEGKLEIRTTKELSPKTDDVGLDVRPMFAQKLSTVIQTATTNTDHSLPNISPAKDASTSTAKPTIDPYREIPE